ncbi:hypothetical protein LR48_Vigan04g100200 [Vigna angularis]|uniref:Uncharacterized protein n=1 Tax=Phaseolus angularis TaxID=3914 RepID=A0A0L9UE31_PHAAN|nr:hypothetical protein LR48_Vigan04g100200 [Vigna angularis]
MKIHVSIVPSQKDWIQFRASRESEEWKGKRLAAQERQRLNDAPHLLSQGGYAKLKKKIRKSRADALGLELPDLAPAPARYMDTIVVDQGRSSMYEFVEPQTIQPSGRTGTSAIRGNDSGYFWPLDAVLEPRHIQARQKV